MQDKKIFDVIIVGGGAAGLIAAAEASKRGLSTLIREKNSKPGRKIMITGKGRCNVTNDCDIDTLIKNIHTNSRFLYSSLNLLTPQDLMRLIEEYTPLKVERGNRVFPVSDKAGDIVDALYRRVKLNSGQFRQAHITEINKDNSEDIFVLKDNQDNLYNSKNLLICTGGLSYPQTGSTGDGYKFAEQFGHKIIQPRPSLVPIECNENICTKMMGLSLKNVRLTLKETGKKKPIFSEIGEMLFTHFGISGPLVLSASAFINPDKLDKYSFSIDFKPALSDETLNNRLQKDFSKFSNKNFSNALDELLPSKSIPIFIKLSKISPDTKVNQISKDQRKTLVNLLKNLTLTIKRLRPISEAIITSGGISVKEVNPKTMESKLVNNLYFAGEVLDVDAYTGGFNLQIAFSTGYSAGKYIGLED